MTTSLRWPPALPQRLPLETKILVPSNYIETEVEMGPKKRRQRFTAVPMFLDPDESRYLFSHDQMEAMFFFFQTTTGSGVLPFMWLDPIPGWGDVEMRFCDEPPSFTCVIPGTTQRWYTCKVRYERLP